MTWPPAAEPAAGAEPTPPADCPAATDAAPGGTPRGGDGPAPGDDGARAGLTGSTATTPTNTATTDADPSPSIATTPASTTDSAAPTTAAAATGAGRHRSWLAPLVAAATVVAGYWPLLLGRLPGGYDVLTYSLPDRVEAARALRHLHLPLWDPFRFAGVPFLANPQTAVLYPPHWLLAALPAERGLAWSYLAHLLLAGAGAYLLARGPLRCSPLAASLAGAAFALSGFAHGQLEHYEQITSLAWLPWAILAADRAVAAAPTWRSARRPVAGLAAALTMTALAGHTQYLFMALATVALWSVAVARPVGRALRAGAGIALGLGLAAVQLVPTGLLARTSVRSHGLSLAEAGRFSLPRADLLTAFRPDYLHPHRGSFEWWAWLPWTVLALALLALASRAGGRRAALLVALAVGGAIVALGPSTPAFRAVYHLPEASSFRVPARWLLLPDLAIPLLAALGLDRLRRRLHAGQWVAAAIVVVAGAELLAAGAHTPNLQRTIDPLAIHLATGDGGRVLSVGVERFGDRVAQRRAQIPNTGVLDHARTIDGYDGGLLVSRAYAAAMATLTGRRDYDPTASLRSNIRFTGGAPLDAHLLEDLDVTTVLAHDPPFDVARLLPRGSVHTGQGVWTTPSLGPVFVSDATGDHTVAGLRLERDTSRPERLVVDVPPAAGDRTVVVSEAAAAGWSARHGRELKLRTHDGLLMAFTAPPGGGRVVLRYRAPGLAAGAAVSLLALVALTTMLLPHRPPR
jgi:hypothetical protein